MIGKQLVSKHNKKKIGVEKKTFLVQATIKEASYPE
jgi:hypothetical protein